jgi:CheY-like chemotaxis protein
MLFGKRKQVVKRILIVEDEPLTAFDNENILGDAGYEIVATVDDLDEALDVLERQEIHLILSDVRLKKRQTGIKLARAAKGKGIPTLFATGQAYPGASEIAIGCLLKPYTERQLCQAIRCVDRHLQGEKVKAPKGLELFIAVKETE